MRLFPGLLENRPCMALQIIDTVQIDFGGPAVFMAKDSLDSADGNVVSIHDGGSGMPDWMKPEISNPCLLTKTFHELLSVAIGGINKFAAFFIPISVPEYPGLFFVTSIVTVQQNRI